MTLEHLHLEAVDGAGPLARREPRRRRRARAGRHGLLPPGVRAADVVEHPVEQHPDAALPARAEQRVGIGVVPEPRVDAQVVDGVVAVGLGVEDRTEQQAVAAQVEQVVEPRRDPAELVGDLAVRVGGRVGADEAQGVDVPPDGGVDPAAARPSCRPPGGVEVVDQAAEQALELARTPRPRSRSTARPHWGRRRRRAAGAPPRRSVVTTTRRSSCGSRRRSTRPGGLQPLEQRRQGAGVEPEPSAQLAHRQRAVGPQGQHHEVLRVGEAHVGQHLGVAAGDGPRRGIQREADLPVEVEWVVRAHPHDTPVAVCTIRLCTI